MTDLDALVERLRARAAEIDKAMDAVGVFVSADMAELLREAAASIAELRDALEPFAKTAELAQALETRVYNHVVWTDGQLQSAYANALCLLRGDGANAPC